MKQPSVPSEEKWGVGERPANQASRPGNGAGNSTVWLPNGHGRRLARVEPTDRQRLAVEAYCREVCSPEGASAATTEALKTFSVSAARLGHRATPEDHARVLSRVMRAAAASHAAIEPSGPGWRSRVADALTAERDVGCGSVPALLARRANRDLAGSEAAALRDHLRDCLRCRATEVRMARAERTFATASRLGMMPPGVTGVAFTAAGAAATPTAPTDAVATKGSPARRRRRLGPIPVAAGVGVLAACGVAAAAVLGGEDTHHAATNAASTPSARVFSAPATARSAHKAHHRAPVVHHHVHKPKPKHKPKPRPAPTQASTAVTAARPAIVSSGGGGGTGASSPAASAPVAAAPTPAPAPSSGSSGGSGGSGSSATIQQPSLGATSAPTQGIGNKH